MFYDPSDAKSIYLHAVELSESSKRAAFLDQACAGKPELRERVECLLKAASEPDSLIDCHAGEFAATQIDDEIEPLISLDFLDTSGADGSLGRLGGYEVLEVIGRGGMGIVLRALDSKLNRVVAIKVLAPELTSQPQARKRFLREAQAAAAVSHDHVVTIHAVDDGASGSSKVPLLVMECIVGQSLQQKIDKVGALSLKEILRIGMQIASGLAAAHKQGLVHRDIKPANILLENGVERVKITDFGLARAMDGVGITVSGQIAGTPQYMSPEQAMGKLIDQRSDIFSLGSVLYTMCTGRPAFRADSAVAILRRVCDDTPRPINEVNAEIPDWLIAIVNRLMAKEPGDRFQSAQEVASLLEQSLAHVQQPQAIAMPQISPAAKLTPTTNSRGGMLGRAWHEWWSERDRWMTISVQTVLILAYLACMVCFVSFRLSTSHDSEGRVTSTWQLGAPSPWFKFEVYPEPLVPFRTGFHLWSSSVLIGLVGCVIYYVYWRIEKVRDPTASQWRGPSVMLGGWGVAAMLAVGFGHWQGYAALNKPREAVTGPNAEPEPATATVAEDHAQLQQILELAHRDLESARQQFEAQTISVNTLIEAEIRVTEAELRLAAAQGEWLRHDQLFATLTEHYRKIRDHLQKQYEAGIIADTEVRRSETALLNVQQRRTTSSAAHRNSAPDSQAEVSIDPGAGSVVLPTPDGKPSEPGKEASGTAGSAEQQEAAIDFNGDWNSGWGPVTLSHPKFTGLQPVEVSGYYFNGKGKITGKLDPQTGLFRGSFHEPNGNGRLQMVLSADGTTIDGGFDYLSDPLEQVPPKQPWRMTRQNPQPASALFDAVQARQHQEAWAKYLGVKIERTNSIGMKLQLIPPGKFQMGSTPEELDQLQQELEKIGASDYDKFIAQSAGPRHVVELSQPFYMGQFEVTIAEFRQFVEETSYQPSAERAGNAKFTWKNFVPDADATKQPVCGVSWEDAKAYCQWLSRKDSNDSVGYDYDLPTEAQWEYACRAGSESRWSFGDDAAALLEYAIVGQRGTPYPASIGLRRANPFGLFDMHGNVDEWCLDWHQKDFYGRSPLIDPVCSALPVDAGSGRVARGGAWNADSWWAGSATRAYDFPTSPVFTKGFRVVCRVKGQ
jgi:serine/threonine protein kinase/formylglycine-generating enzyme required for sulfatase activity